MAANDHGGWNERIIAEFGTVAVHAVALRGSGRDAAWARFTAVSPGFSQYEERTTRTIPVVELRRRTGDAG